MSKTFKMLIISILIIGDLMMYDNTIETQIMTFLKTFGSLPLSLLIELFKPNVRTAEYIISRLVQKKMLFYTSENNIGLYAGQNSDVKTIKALWVLCEYIEKVDKSNIYKTTNPFKIGFISDKQLYKIAVPEMGDDMIFHVVKFSKDETYILAVPNELSISEYEFLGDYKVTFFVSKTSDITIKPEFNKYKLIKEGNT